VEIIKVLTLRGPNIWASFPVLEAWVDLGDLKDTSSADLPGFNQRLTSWLPSMMEHRCSVGERGGFFSQLERGTCLAHTLEHVALELQTLAGTNVGFGRACGTREQGIYRVIVRYKDEALARACLRTGRELLLAAACDRPFDVQAELQKLRELAHDVCLGPSTAAIVRAAVARNIPFRRLNTGSLVQLGYGAKQRRICAAETDRTGAIAESIAQDKQLTRALLRAIGVPTPEGRTVHSAEDAWEAAEEIGLPVVVKPQYGNHGRGVTTNLTTREQVLAAYAAAFAEESAVMVERHATGADWRLLVVGDRLVAAARREPPTVTGDGTSTVEQLVDEINRDPRRSDGHGTVLSRIPLDPIAEAVLADQGYTRHSVPPAGAAVLLRRNANLSTGGTAADVTDSVHPEVAARAVEAVRMIGLDIAGVDVIAQDIRRPLEEQGGVIVEINAGPGLRMHLEPSAGSPRPVGEAIVGLLFPEGQTGRIPVAAVTGTNGKTTTTRLIAHLLKTSGLRVGMTSTDGIFIDGRRIDSDDCAGPLSARNVLQNPKVEAAVLETARGGILREGLGFDCCNVGVVTNIADGDHLGIGGIDTPEQLAAVKRTIVEAVAAHGYAVLNAADPLTAAMASHCPGKVIYFARDPSQHALKLHWQAGKRVVFVRDEWIVLAEGNHELPIISLDRVPLTHGGRIGFQVENVLAAVAAGWGLGLSAKTIEAALETFGADMATVPGRFNLLEINGATVVVDYGHNPASLAAMIDSLRQFPHRHRSVVYSAAGDRRDGDLVRQGKMLGDFFDRVILYEDHYTRGRADGEIMRLFRQGLASGARVTATLDVHGAVRAVDTALRTLRPGDLVLMQADKIDETVDFIRRFLANTSAGHEIDLVEALDAAAEPAAVVAPAATAEAVTLARK
jgi:cyanophycin synthetase